LGCLGYAPARAARFRLGDEGTPTRSEALAWLGAPSTITDEGATIAELFALRSASRKVEYKTRCEGGRPLPVTRLIEEEK
jgi:hypothetical protein